MIVKIPVDEETLRRFQSASFAGVFTLAAISLAIDYFKERLKGSES